MITVVFMYTIALPATPTVVLHENTVLATTSSLDAVSGRTEAKRVCCAVQRQNGYHNDRRYLPKELRDEVPDFSIHLLQLSPIT